MTNNIPSLSDKALLNILAHTKEATAIYVTEEFHIGFINKSMLKLWNKPNTVINQRLVEAAPEFESFIPVLKEVWENGEPYTAIYAPANIDIQGQLITLYFDFECRSVLDENGKTYAIVNTVTDVTERVKALELVKAKKDQEQALNEELTSINEEQEEAIENLRSTNVELEYAQSQLRLSNDRLMENEDRIRGMFEESPVGMCILRGPEHIIEIANKSILKIWGRKEKDVLGKPHKIARPELTGQPVYQWLEEVYKTGITRINNEFRVMLYNEDSLREAYVNSIYQPIKSAGGDVNGVLVILDEITDMIKARHEVMCTQDMLNMAVEAGELGTFYYNPATNLFSGNDLLKSWFGLKSNDMLSLKLALDAIAEADQNTVLEAVNKSLTYASGGNYGIEYTIIDPVLNISRIVRAKGKTIFNQNQEPISLIGTLQDITEQKQDDQRKNDFIGMVSHELKTPLTSLNSYIQILHAKAKKDEDSFAAGALDKANKQVRKMITMINGFLNVSRLESGKIHIDKQRFDIAQLLKEAEEESTIIIISHKVVFAPVAETFVNADRDKIGQVINNLISNAVKYSSPGTTIQVACVAINNMVNVSVKDEGMGIGKKDIKKLFERYYRAEEQHTHAIAGFGIGLYLCSEIIQRHEGIIGVDSEMGKGSRFYFGLPISNVF